MDSRYIIDTNVFLQYPEVLALARKKRLVIPQAVLNEVHGSRVLAGRSELQDTIKQAFGQGLHVATTPEAAKLESIAGDAASYRLSGADIDIAAVALDYAEKMGSANVCVITADRDLIRYLSSRGISAITGRQFLADQMAGASDAAILTSAQKAVYKQRRYIVINLLVGIAASLLGNLVFFHYRFILNTFPVWGTIVGLLIVGLALYWYRQHFRLSYGVFEFLVGISMSCYAFVPSFDYSKVSTAMAFQILGGLYVMVRGLDNMGRGVVGSRLEGFWKRWFDDMRREP